MMLRLQSVQNATARLITGAQCCDHITPTLRQLHWLPVQQQVLFKIAVLVLQCPAGQAPSYLVDDRQLVSDARPRQLRSSDSLMCAVQRTWNTYYSGYGTTALCDVNLVAPYRNTLTC